MPEAAAHGSPTTANGKERVSFSDVARAHFVWDANADADARDEYEAKLDAFEAKTGQIVDAYWCRRDASAVALTRQEEPRSRLRRLLGRRASQQYRLYRLSDWVTKGTGQIPDLLHDCDILAIKASHGLVGTPHAVVMQWLLAVEAHILGFIERHGETPPSHAEIRAFANREREVLRRIEDYYSEAGEKRGRLQYTEGMLVLGTLLLLAAAGATAAAFALFGVLDLEATRVREFFACAAAGGMGAIVSVLMRMTRRGGGFTIDHELGRWGVTLLGAYRPLVGSVSGIIVYFLVQTPLVPIEDDAQTFAFYVVVAFLAGFSERWTQVVMSGAMRTVGQGDSETQKPPERPGTPPAATAPPATDA